VAARVVAAAIQVEAAEAEAKVVANPKEV